MASLYCNQVRDSCSSDARHGCSKAQACLKKILHIISTVPPFGIPNPLRCDDGRGSGIDLNLRLGSFLESEKSESLAENSFVGKAKENESDSSVGVEANNRDGKETTEAIAEKTNTEGSSDITDLQARSFVKEEAKIGGESKSAAAEVEDMRNCEHLESGGKAAPFQNKRNRENYDSLALLIEAAEMISDSDSPSQDKELVESEAVKSGSKGNNKNNNSSSSSSDHNNEKNNSWPVVDEYGYFEDISPVVRSKRGRSQVLPYRYRDSVLELWKRPQRSGVVSNKKRLSK